MRRLGLFLIVLFFTMGGEAAAGKLLLIVSVDWEGMHLQENNLVAMEKFRSDHPQVPLLQFLNAAYFTQPGADPKKVVAQIKRVLRPGDELALHIHGWRSLFVAAGVKFRESPTYWGTAKAAGCEKADCGHEVQISAYSVEELRRVIRYSVSILSDNGLGRAQSFRAGGWQAGANGPSVFEALVAEGILVDSSAVPPKFLAPPQNDKNPHRKALHELIKKLWPAVDEATQPHLIGKISEYPDSGALADYVTVDQMMEVFNAGAKLAEDLKRDVFIQVGFHQETAERFIQNVHNALQLMLKEASSRNIKFEFAKLPLAPLK